MPSEGRQLKIRTNIKEYQDQMLETEPERMGRQRTESSYSKLVRMLGNEPRREKTFISRQSPPTRAGFLTRKKPRGVLTVFRMHRVGSRSRLGRGTS